MRLIIPLLSMLLLTPFAATAMTVTGASARALFDDAVANKGYTLQDFESFASNQKLRTQIAGLTFQSHKGTTGGALNGPVNVSTRGPGGTKQIVGTFSDFSSDDGRVGYQISFATPQAAVGIERNWNSGVMTRWFDTTGALLAELPGTVGYQGYVVPKTDPDSKLISRIELDAIMPAATRQVGYSDDLIYGTTRIPEPGLALLLAPALALLARRRR